MASNGVAYKAAWVIDGVRQGPWEDAAVVVEGGRIRGVRRASELSARAKVVDLGEATIAPGIIDTHVHLKWDASGDPNRTLLAETESMTAVRAVRNAIATLASGVTTVRDVGGRTNAILAARDAIKQGLFPGPTILAAGDFIKATSRRLTGLEADGPDELRKVTRQLLKAGVDCIKLMASGGIYTEGEPIGAVQLTVAEMQAAVEAAHHAGRRVAAHCDSAKSIENALDAGVDTIEHGAYITESLVKRMAESGAYLVPTLSVNKRMADEGEAAGMPKWAVEKVKPYVEVANRGFQLAHRAGVKIAAGSDTGGPCHTHNSMAMELEMMVDHGMTPLEAIIAATGTAAEALGVLDVVGTLFAGKRADLTIVRGNALKDIRAFRQVKLVVKDGQAYSPKALIEIGV